MYAMVTGYNFCAWYVSVSGDITSIFQAGVALACSQTLVSSSSAFVVRVGSGSAVFAPCTYQHVLVRFSAKHLAT